jgi:hypothetical protein
MGGPVQRPRLQANSGSRITVRKDAFGLEVLRAPTFPHHHDDERFPPKSARSSKDERTVTTACLQPGPENGLQRPTDFEGRTRAHLILARRTSLHPKAVYICADLSSRPNFSLQSCGGPYISGRFGERVVDQSTQARFHSTRLARRLKNLIRSCR